MPRIKMLRRKYMKQDLVDYIRASMGSKRLSQSRLASQCGMAQQSLGYKLKTGNFSLDDLISIFTVLDTDPELIVKFLKEDKV